MVGQIPSVGRWVHYVLESGPNQGEHRPAVIVRITSALDVRVILHVHVDSPGDFYKHQGPEPLIIQREPLLDNQTYALDTWHWPERVGD